MPVTTPSSPQRRTRKFEEQSRRRRGEEEYLAEGAQAEQDAGGSRESYRPAPPEDYGVSSSPGSDERGEDLWHGRPDPWSRSTEEESEEPRDAEEHPTREATQF